MTQRLNAYQVAPAAYEPMLNLSKYVAECGLEHSLLELVKLRASQINRCAYCLHMHAADARKAGETEARISCSTPGRNPSCTAPASAPPCAGLKA